MEATIILSDAYRKQAFIAGKEVAKRHTLVVPLDQLSPAGREYLATLAPRLDTVDLSRIGMHAGAFEAPGIPGVDLSWAALLAAHQQAAADQAAAARAKDIANLDQTIADYRAHNSAWAQPPRPLPSYAGTLPRYQEAQAAYAEAVARWEQAQAAQKASREAADAEREAAKAAREAEKATWIAAHGSAHLAKAHAAGYDCQRRYVTERATHEHPDYRVDFDDTAAWQERPCPSEEALSEAERVEGRVVWLTNPVIGKDAEEDDYGFEPCEAVTIRTYLGKYDLVREM